MLTVNGDGPADLDPGRLSDVGEVDTPDLKSRLRTESARAILVENVLALAGDDWSVRGLAAAKRAVVSIPLREGGRGTAILPRVGVLPRELGACNLPCLGGNAGTISPTSSNRSSPAQAAGVAVLCRLDGEPVPVGDIMEPKDWLPAATVPVGVDVLELEGL